MHFIFFFASYHNVLSLFLIIFLGVWNVEMWVLYPMKLNTAIDLNGLFHYIDKYFIGPSSIMKMLGANSTVVWFGGLQVPKQKKFNSILTSEELACVREQCFRYLVNRYPRLLQIVGFYSDGLKIVDCESTSIRVAQVLWRSVYILWSTAGALP